MYKILVVIVTYHPDIDELQNLLSILQGCRCDVALVDNNSNNFDVIKNILTVNANLFGLQENIGLPAAQNLAIEKFGKSTHEYFLFLDQDTVIPNTFVDEIFNDFIRVKIFDQHIAAIGPKLIDKRSGYAYKIPKISRLKFEIIGAGRICSYLISSGMFIDASVYKKIGMNNPIFFIDYIDIDLSFRLYRAGYTLYTSEHVSMHHTAADKTFKIFNKHIPLHSPWRKYYQIRNLIFIISSGYAPVRWVFREIISSFFNNFIYLLVSKEKMLAMKYFKEGFCDGISSIMKK